MFDWTCQVNTVVAEKTIDAFRSTGNVMGRKIVVMDQTSRARAKSVSAKRASSSAWTTTVRLRRRCATEPTTVAMAQVLQTKFQQDYKQKKNHQMKFKIDQKRSN